MRNHLSDSNNPQLNKEVLKSHVTFLNIFGIIIFIIGLLMLCYVYFSSYNFILGLSGFDASWIIRLAYLIIIAFIGGFLIKQAIGTLGESRALSVVILMIGLAFLIFVFWTGQIFVEMQYEFNLFTLSGLLFFGIMVVIGVFFLGKGVSDLKRIKNQGIRPAIQNQSELISSPETKVMENGTSPDLQQTQFKICPDCLSKVSLDTIYCTDCGKKLE